MLAVTVASITYSLSGANRLGTPGSLRHLFQMTFVTEGQSAFAGVPRVVVARSGVALAPGEGQGRLVGVAAHGARAERGHQAAAFQFQPQITISKRAQAVGDDEGCAPFHQALH